MPFNATITQRQARQQPCQTCYTQLLVSGVLSCAALHELWRSPFPRARAARVFKLAVCVYSVLPVATFFVECCADPVYCVPAHGHCWALRVRDLVCGVGYWGLGRWLGPLEAGEETGLEDVD